MCSLVLCSEQHANTVFIALLMTGACDDGMIKSRSVSTFFDVMTFSSPMTRKSFKCFFSDVVVQFACHAKCSNMVVEPRLEYEICR